MGARAVIETVISLDKTRFEAGMRKATAAATKFGKALLKWGTVGVAAGVAALTAAVVVFANKTKEGIKEVISFGANLQDLVDRTGESAKSLMILQEAFEQNGVSADQVGITLDRLTRRVQLAADAVAGGKKNSYSNALKEAGVSAESLAGMNKIKRFVTFANALSNMADETRRTQVAMELLDTSAGQFQALFGNPNAYKDAWKSLGSAIDSIGGNAAQFAEIDRLMGSIAKNKPMQFFGGAATGIMDTVETVLKIISGKDFGDAGIAFGEALQDGIDVAVGAFGPDGKFAMALELGATIAFRKAVDSTIGFLKDKLPGGSISSNLKFVAESSGPGLLYKGARKALGDGSKEDRNENTSELIEQFNALFIDMKKNGEDQLTELKSINSGVGGNN